MKRFIVHILCSVFLLAAPFFAQAQEPLYPEKPTGFVNDQAGILGDTTELERTLASFEAETSNEVAVLTIPSTGEVTIEEYAVTLFEKWGIGKRENDNGVLLLVALEDREMRIEVGYGLEGALPDATAKSIITNEITPAFRDGRYADGVNLGVRSIISATEGEYTPSESSGTDGDIAGFIGFGIFVIVFIIIIISSIISSKNGGGGRRGGSSSSNSTWFSSGSSSSSSSSSSFGGFSGGSSGGGGASGGW